MAKKIAKSPQHEVGDTQAVNQPGYYENRVHAMRELLKEKKIITKEEAAHVAQAGGAHDHSHKDVFESFHNDNPITMDDHEITAIEKQVIALGNLLKDKGIIATDEVRRKVEENEHVAGHHGSKVVARAWVDPEYKKRLLENGKLAAEELGIDMSSSTQLIALENSNAAHHVVVCTLCSCYPRMLLGQPPDWYKSTTYRSRVVVDPRRVLKEMGLDLPEKTEIRVVDSTAETRYLIIPKRPEGTEGWNETELESLVSRNCMVGAANALTPLQKEMMKS